eukprot:354194-Ditylum_brightwellii.AAC.1
MSSLAIQLGKRSLGHESTEPGPMHPRTQGTKKDICKEGVINSTKSSDRETNRDDGLFFLLLLATLPPSRGIHLHKYSSAILHHTACISYQ